jgi:hypothetical protein
MASTGEIIRNGCLGPVIALLCIAGLVGALMWRSSGEAEHSRTAPATTLADEEARMGCFLWWEAYDPSILTTDERTARSENALEHAASSSVASVATAARKLQAAYEDDPPFSEFNAAFQGFEDACKAVGERSRR